MEAGNLLITFGIVLTLFSLVLYKSRYYNSYLWHLLLSTFVSVTAALLLLAYYFITINFNNYYVYIYTNAGLSPVYRVATMWIGKEGFNLVWAWITLLFSLVFYRRCGRNTEFAEKATFVVFLVEVFLLASVLAETPFKSTADVSKSLQGHGLNPKFLSPWLLLHPPFILVAYAANAVLFASAVAHMWSGKKEWVLEARHWGRVSWLFLSAGMATGGLWADSLVGWNGFWTWDPVQSGSLVMWLTLTAALHAVAMHQRNAKSYKITAPFLSSLTFIFNLYVAVMMRKGVQGSLHNFLVSETWRVLAVLLGLTVALTALLLLKQLLQHEPNSAARKMALRPLFSLRNLFHVTILLLVMLALVPLLGITHSLFSELVFGEFISIPVEFYNFWSYPAVLVLTLVTGFCMMRGIIDQRVLYLLSFAVAVISLMMALFPDGPRLLDPASEFYSSSSAIVKWVGSASLLSYLPVSLYAVLGAALRLTHPRMRVTRHNIGISLIHLGYIFVILGAVVSTAFDSETNISFATDEPEVFKEIGGGWSVLIGDVNVAYSRNELTQTVVISLYKNNNLYASGTVSIAKNQHFGYIHRAFDRKTLLYDIKIYFSDDRLDFKNVQLTVKVIPLANMVWLGAAAMIGGILLLRK